MCHGVILRHGPRDYQTVAVDYFQSLRGGGAIKIGGACSRGRAPSAPR